MNLNKHREFFNPTQVTDEIHIIGCGAIGSTVAEMLTRLGFEKLHLYDFDTVSPHNITNQMFREKDIGQLKTESLSNILKEINPDIVLELHSKGYNEFTRLSGIVILAVDSIELRKEIVQQHKFNKSIKFMLDCRMELTSAQMYAAAWNDERAVTNFYGTMDFTSEEAKAATPVSACGTTLSVTPTVRTIVSFATANLINYLKDNNYKTMIITDPFFNTVICFPE